MTAPTIDGVNSADRHLRLLTETTAAVNSTLDLEEVLHLVADKVADALRADACFVYLYDDRTDELVLRATHGAAVDEMTRRPRMRPGEGLTGNQSPSPVRGRGVGEGALLRCGRIHRTSSQTRHDQI